MPAALKVRRGGKRLMRRALTVDVAQPSLTAVGAFEPSQHVIERSVLHHEHDDVIDAGGVRRRQPRILSEHSQYRAAAEREPSSRRCCTLEKPSSRNGHLLLLARLWGLPFVGRYYPH